MQEPGLYFPFVHIRDDDWLKMAALYWPSVRRLVPADYIKHDRATARTLSSAGVLRDEDPARLIPHLSWDLARALHDNADRLIEKFSIDRAFVDWNSEQQFQGSPEREPQLGWIHVTKFPSDVLQDLQEIGLAHVGRHSEQLSHHAPPEDWIGLHPAVAGAYMTALASSISKAARFEPLTDQDDLRVATTSSDVGAALGLLMGRKAEPVNSAYAFESNIDAYVMLALQYARPTNLASVSANKILQCRSDLAEELIAFREYVVAQREELADLASTPVRHRRLEAFAAHVEKTVEIPLRKLEKGLALHKLEPTRSLIVTGSLVPPAAATALGAMPPATATTVGALAAVGAAWWQINSVRESAKTNSPVGYLLDARDRLTSKNLATQVRKIFRGTYSGVTRRR
ncbi:DUF6236 family protein [Micromonospora sp. C28ISP2-4]|uniref:DUF6236 family protein n=1 Tax=Micromonospora sp. C28ISP2-4 TaxID=3059523 RepID=UPI00267524D6|nr:DUF6236 family protein [Micromonospora sp. C28ISP2-4]MDO3686168.1 DUF6236 family protein [Micromonospora sp. C28ISP2-4]